MSRPTEEYLRYTHLPIVTFWKLSHPEFVWLPLPVPDLVAGTLMAAWGGAV